MKSLFEPIIIIIKKSESSRKKIKCGRPGTAGSRTTNKDVLVDNHIFTAQPSHLSQYYDILHNGL